MYIVIWRNLFEPNSLKFSVTFVISSTFIKHIHPALRLLERMSAATAQSIETKSRQAYPVFLSSNTKKALIKKNTKKAYALTQHPQKEISTNCLPLSPWVLPFLYAFFYLALNAKDGGTTKPISLHTPICESENIWCRIPTVHPALSEAILFRHG